jgi:DtxR family Mn-dependent transcriptional regulator
MFLWKSLPNKGFNMELILIVIVIILLIIIVYPKIRFFQKRKKIASSNERIYIEDALKHLYDCEDKAINCSLQSIAGSLNITFDLSATLVERLESLGLISNGNSLRLTNDGRSYALRVIRVHRLWERYLADETSIPEHEWHLQAELQEHNLTSEDAESLSAQLGNPVYDPHGDPIPTIDGQLPKKDWRPLSSLNSGEVARIVHIEDEPNTIYAQLVAEGLFAGMHIKMIESSSERIRFEANGEEVIIAPLFAGNISIAPISKFEKIPEIYKRLVELKPGEEAEVVGLAKSCRGVQRRRLMDLGVVPGSRISNEFVSTWGDPIAYKICGATIGLRNKQANQIFIKPVKTESINV